MNTLLKNVEVKIDTDFNTAARVIAFDIIGSGPSLEWIDDGDTLCSVSDSNLHSYLPQEVADDIREQLKAWLETNATVSVAVNGCDDFFVLTVPADADNAAIVEVIEAESLRIGLDPEESVIFRDINAVRVYRNGVEITELAQQATARRERDVLDDLDAAA